MIGRNRAVAALILFAAVPLSGCAETAADTAKRPEPFTLEKLEGTALTRLRLDQSAYDRIGIQTSTVREAPGAAGDGARMVVDYAAVVYEPSGDTALYTSPSPLAFVRQPVTVESIEGDVAVLAAGPPAGTAVVTVGTALLLGMEFGVGK
jgi:hypothetical protein